MEYVQQDTALGRLLDSFREQQATDLHGQADKPYSIRVHGRLSWVSVECFAPPTNEEIQGLLRESFSPAAWSYVGTNNINVQAVETGIVQAKRENMRGLPLKDRYALIQAERKARANTE
jgi:Tfp pilus assembly pilus retraction ATPase PilT